MTLTFFMYGLEYMHVTHRLNELDMYDKLFENLTDERFARDNVQLSLCNLQSLSVTLTFEKRA